MLAIRLRRTGKKGQPSYRIVVADERASVYGKYIDLLGNYNPFTKKVVLDNQKALDWMNKGAKPSNTVAKIFQKAKIEHKSIVIKQYRAVSKKELETQKAQDEAEKAKIAAEKEAQKAAFEEKVEAEKAAHPTSEDKLQEAVEETIKEEKAEAQAEVETKEEAKAENIKDEAENKEPDKKEGTEDSKSEKAPKDK